jgi:deoxyribose-phosphate aldolase
MISIAQCIDYTLLKATAAAADVERMCGEARDFQFATICIQPVFVKLCAELLAGSGVGVTTVIGFPFGAAKPEVKAFEAAQAVADGATEVDMVMNIGEMLSGNVEAVREDIEAVVNAVAGKAIVKVIIETAYLSADQIREASGIVKAAGANFVKTSTGYAPSGAKSEDIRIIREAVGPGFGIKASGGISSYQAAKEMLEAGATRFGASAAIKIVKEEKSSRQ